MVEIEQDNNIFFFNLKKKIKNNKERMYEKLETYGKNNNIKENSKKYPCLNYISPETNNFSNYFNLPSSQNTNINQLPFYKVNEEEKINPPPIQLPKYSENKNDIEEKFTPIYKEEFKNKSDIKENFIPEIIEEIPTYKPNEMETKLPPYLMGLNDENSGLLPVLDYKFNMREICKQCILLEDHLSQVEKRCPDCCIKHFLALEALSEEAIQLDKQNEGVHILKDLPNRIRGIQKKWYNNPTLYSNQCSQDLRGIRKELMETSFPIIFSEEKNKKLSCNSSVCSLK